MLQTKNNKSIVIFSLIGLAVFTLTLVAESLEPKLYILWPFTITLLVVLIIIGFFSYLATKHRKFHAIQIANIDAMSGVEFEQYLQKLLGLRGYSVNITQATGDLGVDLIASLGAYKYAVQAKRSRSKISRRAVSDAVAGLQHYCCNRAMVITNNYFTRGAVTLAQSTNCTLVDRDLLGQWIVELQNTQIHKGPIQR
jgi:HJR/Mrr/RecB family endonuclease